MLPRHCSVQRGEPDRCVCSPHVLAGVQAGGRRRELAHIPELDHAVHRTCRADNLFMQRLGLQGEDRLDICIYFFYGGGHRMHV